MRLLIDTQLVYWSYYESFNLPEEAVRRIRGADAVYVSSASIWEIAIKVRIGKMKADPWRIIQRIEASGYYELPVWSRHTAIVADLPLYHSDPFDRLLVAQAMSEPLHLLTTDSQLKQYSKLVIQV
jgi:PIN domain nuclease of toxin-antitoxin system